MKNKIEKLRELEEQICRCSDCRVGKIGECVPGEGSANASIMFVGEAPGKMESQTGRPFIGRSGKLLRQLIKNTGFSDTDIYITSVVKYLPLTGTPQMKDIDHGKIHLRNQIDLINPKIIILLGNIAVIGAIGEKLPITKMHGTIKVIKNRIYFLTVHPASALRFLKYKKILTEDFMKLKEYTKPTFE